MVKENKIKTFTSALPKNIFSGFVVSLIALPLGLGLAIASGAPPISGVISAIIGGILVSILGGSNVTIAGPGNGLVVVVLSAITVLGNGDMQQGFLYTLAAIVISGILMIILGFLRMGTLGDYFPSSAIQGMLAAIGIGILAKQFHLMLGNINAKGSIIELLIQMPQGIIELFSSNNLSILYAGGVGIISLLIMVFYSKIRNRFFQLIPAPMWIVVLSVGLFYYFEYFSDSPYPIDSNLLINIPNDIFGNIASPNFSKVWNFDFINVVIALTLIASIESLLSIKAVDKLDPLKRRSNVNKDLKALGIATTISGFLGGLNVVIVIARSSVNVNNNASNRSANFFHSAFLILFILLFTSELRKIPLPALAAILVYTGYKLASPDNIKKIFKIGKEQLIIFLVTLIITISTSLITGIISGIIVTLLIHSVINKSILMFIRNMLKPNVLMYKEDDSENNYYVSVKNYCTFLNYNKLKSKLDQIPEDKEVIVDFSMCDFVDHSVMENMSNYIETFKRKEGNFEIVGLDNHGTDSEHPFALRRLIPFKNILSNQNFTKRQNSLLNISKELEWNFNATQTEIESLSNFGYFKTRKVNSITNILSNSDKCRIFDIEFSEGELFAKQVIRATMFYIKLDNTIPEFTLDREGIFEYIYHFTSFKDIILKDYPDFSKRFYLAGKNEDEIRTLFSHDLVLFFESNPYYHIESNEKALLIVGKERLASVRETKSLADFGMRLQKIISKC
jgi:MFS superfamily sulfate permease-like transporter